MLIRKRVVRTDSPPVIVDHRRDVVVERDDTPIGLIAAVAGVVLLIAGLIGYYSWWGPSHTRTEVVVEQPVNTDGRAQRMESPPPPSTTIITPPPVVNTQPPVINVNPPAPTEDKTIIIERERQQQREENNRNNEENTGTEGTETETTSGSGAGSDQ
jgi:hypothetical protein